MNEARRYMRKVAFSVRKKKRIKVIRTMIEIIILIIAAYAIINAFITFVKYKPVSEELKTYDNGFIALSYFGVDRSQKETLISKDRLYEQLKALKASGYETISQQDIIDYYTKGKKLPENALFLAFEDGRKDSALFAEPILENLNYQANMFTYADKFAKEDTKFLTLTELLKMKESTFWELGTNGYRLEYINVFDRYNNFLNVLDSNEFTMMSPYIDKNYNHYLMDFIKDADGVPIEDADALSKRIADDYENLSDIYKKGLGFIPEAYVLMHSNTPYYGTSSFAGQANKLWINKLFKMTFNREGSSLNTHDSGIYDLTRIEPQPYWYTNHLLMRIKDDTKKHIAFVSGDENRKKNWDTVSGQSEFRKDSIVLTSPPSKDGIIRLNNSENYKNIHISLQLEGNVLGIQDIYLRSDSKMESYIKISLKDNNLYVYEKDNGTLKQLYSLDLRKLVNVNPESIPEDKLNTEKMFDKTILKYSNSKDEMDKAMIDLNKKNNSTAPSVNQGAQEYVPKISEGKIGSRKLEAILNGDSLNVYVDNKMVVNSLKISNAIESGSLYLGARQSDNNKDDDVYDGVFKDMVVTDINNNQDGKVLYSNKLNFKEKTINYVSTTFNNIVNWFIETF